MWNQASFVCVDKGEHTAPRVGRGFSMFGGAAIEEAMRCAGISNNFMLNADPVQGFVERFALLRRNAGVGTAVEAQNRHTDAMSGLEGSALFIVQDTSEAGIKCDHALEAQVFRAGVERD